MGQHKIFQTDIQSDLKGVHICQFMSLNVKTVTIVSKKLFSPTTQGPLLARSVTTKVLKNWSVVPIQSALPVPAVVLPVQALDFLEPVETARRSAAYEMGSLKLFKKTE